MIQGIKDDNYWNETDWTFHLIFRSLNGTIREFEYLKWRMQKEGQFLFFSFFYLEEKLQSSFNRLMANLFKREARMIDLENKF